VDWIGLIGKYLDIFLLKCLEKVSTESPQEYLRAHYDPVSGTMDAALVRDCYPQTLRAIRKARQSAKPKDRRDMPRNSRAEVLDMTEARLIEDMNADESEVNAVRAMVAGMGSDD
jgi:hypothetical protein